MNKLSIIIPARNEIYLEKTIHNVLSNATGDIEILPMLDGWLPNPQIVIGDDRVKFHYFEKSIGQRAAINEGARRATGNYIMKLDAHCAMAEGFDTTLINDCQYEWTMVPRMYVLNKDTWQPKLHKHVDYMYISSPDYKESPFRMQYYEGRTVKDERQRQPVNNKEIDDTMCCLGACFFMHMKRFWELGGCDEDHGSWGQQGIEVALKAWLSGGNLKVNKRTWFAHMHRSEGFPYLITNKDVDEARRHSQDLWLNDKWHLAKRELQWVVDKFNPPHWNSMDSKINDVNNYLYYHIHKRKNYPQWKGIDILKMPSDLLLYSKVIQECKPEIIIEIGTKFGGSALYHQDNLDLIGGGQVVTIDINPQVKEHDPRITYLIGDSTSKEIIAKIKELTQNKKTMIILDGDHSRVKVKWELHHYADLVSVGQYLVIEDCYARGGKLYGPGEARDWFLKRNNNFIQTNLDNKFLVGMNIGGWLKRVK